MANATLDIRKLLAERRDLVAKLDNLNKRELSPEEKAAWDELTAKVAELDSKVAAIEDAIGSDEAEEAPMEDVPAAAPVEEVQQNSANLDNLQKRLLSALEKAERQSVGRRSAPAFVRDLNDARARKDKDLALRGWLLGNRAGAEHRAAAQRTGLDLWNPNLTLTAETRDNSTSSSAGGYTIPQGFLAELEKKQAFFNPLLNVARVINTAEGNTLPMPTIDDTSNLAALGAEGTAVTAVDLTFGTVNLSSYRLESLVIASNELLRDTGINLETEIGGLLGERIGRKQAAYHATGTGSSQPEGVVTGSSAGVTAASATAIAINDLISLCNSLDAAYWPNARFMMHQSVWAAILKLQDSQGRPLVTDYINGNAPKLLGYEVILNNNMASSIATTNKTVLFGDFSKYYIRQVGSLELIRLNELYANKYQTGFMVVSFEDAKVVQSAAIKRLTQA